VVEAAAVDMVAAAVDMVEAAVDMVEAAADTEAAADFTAEGEADFTAGVVAAVSGVAAEDRAFTAAVLHSHAAPA
jgi:hypothetical protein